MNQENNHGPTAAEWLKEREKNPDKHSVWVEDGAVMMAHNNDGYYGETFTSHEDVERFVAYLLLMADEAWPNQ